MFKITKEKITIKKFIFVSLGSISLGLGVIGLFLPVLPTTPFLLLTAWFYAKSSQRMYFWLLNNKYFGRYIKRYREGLGIPLKTKIIALSSLWITILTSIIFFIPSAIIKILLLVIAFAVTYHILSRPTFRGV
ncbi:MAG: YbaN family protein [bacterium]